MSDLISREEVLRAIITSGEVEPDLGYTHLHKVIENLPSAEPKWIPVSERRPVLFDRFYLVTVQLEPVGRATDYCVWDGLKWISPFSANPNVIAWMPKPEPFKGGE